jgi:hypothetical protein
MCSSHANKLNGWNHALVEGLAIRRVVGGSELSIAQFVEFLMVEHVHSDLSYQFNMSVAFSCIYFRI